MLSGCTHLLQLTGSASTRSCRCLLSLGVLAGFERTQLFAQLEVLARSASVASRRVMFVRATFGPSRRVGSFIATPLRERTRLCRRYFHRRAVPLVCGDRGSHRRKRRDRWRRTRRAHRRERLRSVNTAGVAEDGTDRDAGGSSAERRSGRKSARLHCPDWSEICCSENDRHQLRDTGFPPVRQHRVQRTRARPIQHEKHDR
jgi:hypothetical protein